jgi:hypothetical protein
MRGIFLNICRMGLVVGRSNGWCGQCEWKENVYVYMGKA